MRVLLLALAFATPAWAVQAQSVLPPAAVVADPPFDTSHPPKLVQVRYASGGVDVPARLFVAGGSGPHSTVLLLHGFPGTELNLDLARAIQRAGWNVMAIHYRGVWGAPGQFSFSNTVEDARAALDWLRDPARSEVVDDARIVVLGHSMGGFDAVMLGDDPGVAGFVTISATDLGARLGRLNTPEARRAARPNWQGDLGFTNMTYEAMVDEGQASLNVWNWDRNAAEMAGRPVLVIDADDGLEGDGDRIVAAIAAAGGPAPSRLKFPTDHSYNDHRIALASAVVVWLETAFH